jgi:hypothetical protein
MNSALVGGEWSASSTGHFIPGESPSNPVDNRLGGSQNLFGRHGEEKKAFPYRDTNEAQELKKSTKFQFYTSFIGVKRSKGGNGRQATKYAKKYEFVIEVGNFLKDNL